MGWATLSRFQDQAGLQFVEAQFEARRVLVGIDEPLNPRVQPRELPGDALAGLCEAWR